jgi:hypothetical protein
MTIQVTAERQARSRTHRILHALLGIVCGLLALLFGICGLCLTVVPFTEGSRSGDSFAADIGAAVFTLIIAFCFGLVTRHCYKQTQ